MVRVAWFAHTQYRKDVVPHSAFVGLQQPEVVRSGAAEVGERALRRRAKRAEDQQELDEDPHLTIDLNRLERAEPCGQRCFCTNHPDHGDRRPIEQAVVHLLHRSTQSLDVSDQPHLSSNRPHQKQHNHEHENGEAMEGEKAGDEEARGKSKSKAGPTRWSRRWAGREVDGEKTEVARKA